MAPTGKRRLPVLQSPSKKETDDSELPRSGVEWVGFGTVITFVIWLPAAALFSLLRRRLIPLPVDSSSGPDELASLLASLPDAARTHIMTTMAMESALPLLLAATLGGYIVGRFAPYASMRFLGALTGGAVGAIAVGLATLSGFVHPTTILVPLIATLFAQLGAWWGRKRNEGAPGRAASR